MSQVLLSWTPLTEFDLITIYHTWEKLRISSINYKMCNINLANAIISKNNIL